MSWLETYGFVYVVHDGTAYKIGETGGCIQERLKTLQAGNPRRIQFIHCYETPDRKECEKHFHRELAPYRCQGGEEWFDCNLEDIEEAAESVEQLFGAVKCDVFRLNRVVGTFTREIVDYWFMGETLTLQMGEAHAGDHRDINIATGSKLKRSAIAGQEILRDLRKLLQTSTHDEMHRKLIRLASQRRPRWILTYSRKRSPWLLLNDVKLLSIKYEKQKEFA